METIKLIFSFSKLYTQSMLQLHEWTTNKCVSCSDVTGRHSWNRMISGPTKWKWKSVKNNSREGSCKHHVGPFKTCFKTSWIEAFPLFSVCSIFYVLYLFVRVTCHVWKTRICFFLRRINQIACLSCRPSFSALKNKLFSEEEGVSLGSRQDSNHTEK